MPGERPFSCFFSVIDEECKCYEEYDLKTFNETTEYQKVSGDTVLENLAFDKNNLLRNASKIQTQVQSKGITTGYNF